MAVEGMRIEKPAAVRLSEALAAPVMGEECGGLAAADVMAGCAGIPFGFRR